MTIGSSTCLMEFSKTHPEIFDLLQCQFARTVSAMQIIEAANGKGETHTTTSNRLHKQHPAPVLTYVYSLKV